ncbi:beta-aspartyl-peptidase [Sporomusa malonica]|uniref:Isoaspartyl dipeptidase n=1 Tax=Sporomusa malonica TaxID=112901 RepID=A0A1W1ZN30_9FIRM|nr:beta-aspartyl-peptidase [Sporomusa malonica]SMC49829.1 beta-aspartyl-dipeptidase (metallo-type) [Sporomusa malonica]
MAELLIRNGSIYAPEFLGEKDILIIGNKVIKIATAIDVGSLLRCLPDVEVIDAKGKVVVPGFIDQHVHLIGGGGETGFASRTPEIALSSIIKAGVTTVVGLLGTDGFARSVEALFAKAMGLETEGITTLIYTGSYKTPSVTITGSIARDIMFVDKVIGVKMALADHRSSNFTFEELTRLAADARVAGMLSGKPGLVHIHMGEGKEGLNMVMEAVRTTEIPVTQFIPTHVTRSKELFMQAKEFAKRGGRIDITSYGELTPADEIKPSRAIMECLREGVPVGNVAVSSDGNGSVPKYDSQGNIIGMGVGRIEASQLVLKNLVIEEGLGLETALRFFTSNVASILGICPEKGYIKEGSDADIVIMDREFNIDMVLAKGRKMMTSGEVMIKGTYETC